jgi:lysozyme family protein
MPTDFEKLKPLIFAAEGGVSDSVSDRGGLTRLGISQRSYPDLKISSLTDDQCYLILEQDYWNYYRLGEINDQTVAGQCLLLFINMPPEKAGNVIQAAIHGCGQELTIDGVVGSVTLRSLNSLPAGWLSDRLRTEASRYYLQLTDENKAQVPNFRGWIRRVLL